MGRFDLVGPTYQSQSLNADAQRTFNWYPEVIESGSGRSKMALYPTPGKKLFASIPGNHHRASIEVNGRAFAIVATNFVEVFQNGTFNVIGQVPDDFLPASMATSPQQILIASAGILFVYFLQAIVPANAPAGSAPLPAGTFAQINAAPLFPNPGFPPQPISQVAFSDGFFLALVKNSAQFFISVSLDASSWVSASGLQQIIVSVFTDNVQSLVVSQRRLYLHGLKQSTVYYLSGSSQIYDVDLSAGVVENGSAAPFGAIRADNSVFWLDKDERGAGIFRRYVGYTPSRISNHSIESIVKAMPNFSDAVAYSYQESGHTFACWLFPSAQQSLAYDIATGMWCDRGFWNVGQGRYTADRAQTHMFAFGKHLVGDPQTGALYDSSINYFDDFGNPIRRLRRAPHIAVEQKRVYYTELLLDFETGRGPIAPLRDGNGNPRDPQVQLRWSNDSGHTWSNFYSLDCGQNGQYKKRVRKARLGSSKTGRTFEISCTDPIAWNLVDGYLQATPGFAPQERITKQYAKVA